VPAFIFTVSSTSREMSESLSLVEPSQSDNDGYKAESTRPKGPSTHLSPTPAASSTSRSVDPRTGVLANPLDKRAGGESSGEAA